MAQFRGILPDSDGVEIDHAIDRLIGVFLHVHKTLHCAQVVAKRQAARWLDAREDTGCELALTHGLLLQAGNFRPPRLRVAASRVKERRPCPFILTV